MPELRTPNDLARVLGDVAGSDDPIGELRRRGFQITGDLKKALQGAKPSAPLSMAQRRRFARLAGIGKVTFRVGAPAAPRLRQLAPDDYDVIAGIQLTLADQVLNGLLQTQTIPQEIPLKRLLPSAQRTVLSAALVGNFANVPLGSEADKLSIRAGISTTPLDGTNTVLLALPFSLDVFHPVTSGGTTNREFVGTLSGKLSVVVRLDADVTGLGNEALAALTISITLPPFPDQGTPQVEIDANSTLQPKPTGNLLSFALLLQNTLGLFVGPSFVVSPFINVPSMPGVQMVVEHVDVRSVATPAGGMLMAGVRFVGAGATPADPTRLARLQPEAGRNVVLRVHERYLDKLLEQARKVGVLDKKVREKSGESNAKVKSSNVEFSPGQIKIFLEGVIPDKCPPVDVDFTVTQTFSFSVKDGAIVVDSFTDTSVSTADLLFCAVEAFLVGLLTSLPILMVAPFLGMFEALLTTHSLLDDLPGDEASVSILSLTTPIPRTQFLPALDQLVSRADEEELVASAAVTLQPDRINTYIFARVMESTSPFVFSSGPIANATVQVFDQDAPPPPGDDVKPPEESETETVVGNKFIITKSTVYERPSRDQALAEGTTNFDGRIMFTLAPSQMGHTAGQVVNTTIKEDLHSHETKTTSTRKTVTERGPDIYFIVSAKSDRTDSRKSPGGLLLNFLSKQLGTPTEPHLLSLKSLPPILDP